MATYAAAGSNGVMEEWYGLGAFVESRVWAQLMRQISRRAADVGITCDWRNGLVNPGAAEQYPGDDFLVGLAALPITVCQEYMEQIFGTLEEVCEAQYLDDCKLWFFAPNEGSLPFCSGLDGTAPMSFTVPTLVEDRREWKQWMVKMRQVVDALDRLKTVWPIPHPATLYTLETVWVREFSRRGYYLGGTVISGEPRPGFVGGPWGPFPHSGAGYCLDPDEDHAFPGFDALDDDAGTLPGALGTGFLGVKCLYEYPFWTNEYGVVDASSSGPLLRSWAGRGAVEVTVTAKFDDADWAEFVAEYGEVVNAIPWAFDVEPGLVAESEEPEDVGITVTVGGAGSFVLEANAEVEFAFTIDLDVDATEYVLFKDVGAFRGPKCAVRWMWDSESHDFIDANADPDPLPAPVEYAYLPVADFNPAVAEVTACDVEL